MPAHMTESDHLSDTRFEDLPLADDLLAGLEALEFEFCTPIQAKSLPRALKGDDVAGQAQTGTGKTVAFLLATFQYLLARPAIEGRKANQPRALILAPTRELAIQIHKDAIAIGKFVEFKLGLAYGGTGYEQQRKSLEAGCEILIGTPGRVIDYLKQGVFDLRACDVVVLDEADRMFDLGFIKDVRYLIRKMPPPTQRLNMLYSATLSHRVLELAYEHMNEPELVKVEAPTLTADRVRQTIYYPGNHEKLPLLVGLIRELKPDRAMIFINTKRTGEDLAHYLTANGCDAKIISGDVPQQKRQRLLEQFQAGELHLLIATDVAARGLHVPKISHVFNYDLPDDAEDYVHRIGRTARAGTDGDAISFACEDYAMNLPEIESYLGHSLPTEPVPTELLVEVERPPRPRRERKGGRGGQRHSSSRRNSSDNSSSQHKKSTADNKAETPNGNSNNNTADKPKGQRRRRPRRANNSSPKTD